MDALQERGGGKKPQTLISLPWSVGHRDNEPGCSRPFLSERERTPHEQSVSTVANRLKIGH